MARKRFNATERELIETTGRGGRIEWQNVSQWHPATLDGSIRTDDGWQSVMVINHGTTKTIHAGLRVAVSPGHIRAAS